MVTISASRDSRFPRKRKGKWGNFGCALIFYTKGTGKHLAVLLGEKLFSPHICAFSLTDLWSSSHPEAKQSLVSVPAFSFTVRSDFVFFRFLTFPLRWHILVMLMMPEPQGTRVVLGTGCTCQGLCRFYQCGSKYPNKWRELAKTTVVTVYDFIKRLQLLWWLCDAGTEIESMLALAFCLIYYWVPVFLNIHSVFFKWCKSKDVMQDQKYLKCLSKVNDPRRLKVGLECPF